jgi:hypothetical protein
VIVADDSTNVTAPPITFTGDTNTGIGHSAADTLDLVTGGQPRFRIEPTGQIKAVYESLIGTDYDTQLDNGYLCRAWVNFNGTLSNTTGTYTRSGNTITCTITAHGLTTGQTVNLDFTSGGATDGIYVATVTGVNTFTVQDIASGTITTSNVTMLSRMIRASGNVSSVTKNATGDYTINFLNAMPDGDYCIHGSSRPDSNTVAYGGNFMIGKFNVALGNDTLVGSVRVSTAKDNQQTFVDSPIICVAVFR